MGLRLFVLRVVGVQPGNIFVKSGHYKLGDFGLVSPVDVKSGAEVVEGDSRYMSKELLKDDHSNLTKVSERWKNHVRRS